jgi:hypothetical protein
MKINNNIKPVNSSSLSITKEDIIIIFFLVLFTAISVILISFCFDTFIGSFSQSFGEDYLLKKDNICPINSEVTSCVSIKRDIDTDKNGLSIFNSFIDLFNKNHSRHRYFPSLIQTSANLNSNILSNKAITLLNTDEIIENPQNLAIAKEVISYNQYLILEHHNNHLNALLNDLCKILLEYTESNNI